MKRKRSSRLIRRASARTRDCDPVAGETSSSARSAVLRTSAAWPCAKGRRADNVGWFPSAHTFCGVQTESRPGRQKTATIVSCWPAAPRKKIAAHNDMIASTRYRSKRALSIEKLTGLFPPSAHARRISNDGISSSVQMELKRNPRTHSIKNSLLGLIQ